MAEAVEEDEIAGPQAAAADRAAVAVLGSGIVRQTDAELRVDVGDETRAVEPARRAAAVAIRHTELRGCDPHGPLAERRHLAPGSRHGLQRHRVADARR